MKRYKNGVPKLSNSAYITIGKLLNKGVEFDAGNIAVNLNPKHHNRCKKIKAISISLIGKKIYVWHHGYHYRFAASGDIFPLNLRNKRVIRFYQLIRSFKKKGCKNIHKCIRL